MVVLRPFVWIAEDEPWRGGAEEFKGSGVSPFPVADGDDLEGAVDEDIMWAKVVAYEMIGSLCMLCGDQAEEEGAEEMTRCIFFACVVSVFNAVTLGVEAGKFQVYKVI